MDFGLKGKNCIVTGSGQGIGEAIALTLAGEGANVLVADMNPETAKKTMEGCKAKGVLSECFQVDVTNRSSVDAMVKKAIDTFGCVDILVNNAAAWRPARFIDSKPEDWDFETSVCFVGTLNVTKAVLTHMVERRQGKILSIGSDAGRVGEVGQPVYSGAKGGVIAFSKALAKEVGRYNINVNVVCPSFTLTPALKASLTPERAEKAIKFYPIGRFGEPEDVAWAVTFMVSDKARHVTGQTLSVNGGYSMV